ncbi:MAG: AAA family ATPase [Pyrinomonadaceae bacterium]
MKLVFIYGPPAAGKLTVAKALADATAFKIFHNHLSINCVEPVFEFGTKPFYRLVDLIRTETIEEAAREKINGLIFTFCYAAGSDEPFVRKIIERVEKHGGEVCLVQLICEKSALEERVLSEERRNFGKASNLSILGEILERHDLFSAFPDRSSLTIDNTSLAPQEAAQRIVAHYNLCDA